MMDERRREGEVEAKEGRRKDRERNEGEREMVDRRGRESMYVNLSYTHSYLTAHIWVCPPSEGDDYLFYCHPVDHVILNSKELIEWLREMLDSGKANGVVYDYQVGVVTVLLIVF